MGRLFPFYKNVGLEEIAVVVLLQELSAEVALVPLVFVRARCLARR
jgi:hypothetical protein